MKRIIFILACLLAVGARAQHGSNAYRDLADSLFEHHHYSDAATYYQRALRNAHVPAPMMLQLARCYQKTNAHSDAATWFEKARNNGATLTALDSYQYARVLMTLNRRRDAEQLLAELLAKDPNASLVRHALDDIRNVQKFYADTTRFTVVSLPINTPVSEFGPAFYKDGIVYTAATQEGFARKKYHWDNSHFLNLYYVAKKDGSFQKPELFEKSLNTRFHDGPASFYDNDQRMIVNRNQPLKVEGKEDTWVWHLSLFDAQRSATEKSGWSVTPLPFDNAPYSAAHPAVSGDGNTLYFVSDKPGGYGGTDIYRSTRVDGRWSEPFNLGPTINSEGNEVFPFFIDETLYFASNGHGGLGGLDIFKSTYTVNGFSPPLNMGAPVNSTADDFSFITTGDHVLGYFASSRNGNDDLFSFKRRIDMVPAIAHIYDGVTQAALAGASVQLMASSGEELTLIADDHGDVRFSLPEETAYLLVGTKDGKVGTTTGLSVTDEDERHMVHPMPAYGDTTRIPCVGFVKNDDGVAREAASIVVVDETTNSRLQLPQKAAVLSFPGEKGHTYRVEVANADGDTTTHRLTINQDQREALSWTMTLKEPPVLMMMAARVFNAATGQPLPGADVRVITFSEPDKELKADESGLVSFALEPGAAYMVVATKDNLTGMHSGMAEPGTDKTAVIHPIPATDNPPPPLPAKVMALITDEQGNVLDADKAIVTDRETGEAVAAKVTDGVLTFEGERGKSYNISVADAGYETSLEEVAIPREGSDVEKIAIALSRNIPPPMLMAARVFKAGDQSPLGGARVKVISFDDADQALTADVQGLVEFTLAQGSSYMVIGEKDGFVGMHTGVAEAGTDKAAMIHPVPATDEPEKQLPALVYVMDPDGEPLRDASATITDVATGKEIPVEVNDGLISFIGVKGKAYVVKVSHPEHVAASKEINIRADATGVSKESITLARVPAPTLPAKPVVVNIADAQGTALPAASITVTETLTGRIAPTSTANGVSSFVGESGKDYTITASHDGHTSQSRTISLAGNGNSPVAIALQPTNAPAPQPKPAPVATPVDDAAEQVQVLTFAVRVFKAADGSALPGASVKVISFVEDDLEVTTASDGTALFTLPAGTTYMAVATSGKFVGMHSGVAEVNQTKEFITHPIPAVDEPARQLPVVARITNKDGDVLADAVVTVTEAASGKSMVTKTTDGIFSFVGEKGKDYAVTVAHKDHETQTQRIALPEQSTETGKVSFILDNKDVPPLPELPVVVRVFRADDNAPLPGAQVKVISFVAPDQELIAGEDGIARFTLPEGIAFMAVGSKDDYTGMYQGLADGDTIVHPIPASRNVGDKTTVVASVVDDDGKPVDHAKIDVRNKNTGQAVDFSFKDGIVNFPAEKGTDYVLRAITSNRTAEQIVTVGASSTGVVTETLAMPSPAPATAGTPLIVLHTDQGTPRVYVNTGETFAEITERQGVLVLHDRSGEQTLGEGTIVQLQQNPATFLQPRGISANGTVVLRNIYFDYNKAALSDESKTELSKVHQLLAQYPALKLVIQAHADDRGADSYNLALSTRRAQAVSSYLTRKGIGVSRLCTKGFGESMPAVPCVDKDCSEEEYRKNRRAEFVISETLPVATVYFDPVPSNSYATYASIRQKYGDTRVADVSFKVSIGAYRRNATLTFDNLRDLGTVELSAADGITYYYVSSFGTLNEAEAARRTIVERGVADASITVFYQGKKITLGEFVSMMK